MVDFDERSEVSEGGQVVDDDVEEFGWEGEEAGWRSGIGRERG